MSIYYSDEKLLQIGTALFETLKTKNDIAQELAEFGYDDTKITEGKTLYEKATTLRDANRKESNEEIQAYQVFDKAFQQLVETYKNHRKRAKVVFKDDTATLKILALKGTLPIRVLSLLQEIELLYTGLDKDDTLKNAVKLMKITPENIKEQLEKLTEVKNLYAKYTTEKGESQQATQDKTQAFANLEKWIRDFYMVAKIALEDKPQLLESFGKMVRS